ncbi:MAG TPA: DNA methyltransferase [Candidatus Cryosericum sp.]|nr:DNA methyltransferase [Candidatus Cryosericum sp.]
MTQVPSAKYYEEQGVTLYHGDCLELLPFFPAEHFDMVFADPPYLLSNDGVTCRSGKQVSVNKGTWDRSHGVLADHNFVMQWLSECRRVMRPDATIWVSGTHHMIYSVGFAMQRLGFRILNDIVWYKITPPPNLGCRCFTHSTEIVLWAARSRRSRHTFNYTDLKMMANDPFDRAGAQMKNVWGILPPRKDERTHGKHPTQKPLALLNRILAAASKPDDLVLDPFLGSGTTAVSCLANGRQCVGIELERQYLSLASARLDDRLGLHRLDFPAQVS